MARDPFARAAQGILRRLGKDALLRGALANKVHVEHNVEVYERDARGGDVAVPRSVATFEKQFDPQNGDQLVLLDDDGTPLEAYRVERLVEDNGYTVRRVVSKAQG